MQQNCICYGFLIFVYFITDELEPIVECYTGTGVHYTGYVSESIVGPCQRWDMQVSCGAMSKMRYAGQLVGRIKEGIYGSELWGHAKVGIDKPVVGPCQRWDRQASCRTMPKMG